MKLVFLRLHYLDFAIIKQNVYLKKALEKLTKWCERQEILEKM